MIRSLQGTKPYVARAPMKVPPRHLKNRSAELRSMWGDDSGSIMVLIMMRIMVITMNSARVYQTERDYRM
jgi:hypothetical protein